MNWISKFIKPKIKSLFEKKSSKNEENLWTTCGCKNLIYKEDMEANQKVCPKCGAHHKLTCKERFETFFDNKEFEIIQTPLPKDDPLKFNDVKKYTDRLKKAREQISKDCELSRPAFLAECLTRLRNYEKAAIKRGHIQVAVNSVRLQAELVGIAS